MYCARDGVSTPEFYISTQAPPGYTLPPNITCVVYSRENPLPRDYFRLLERFTHEHNCTSSGNITELSLESLERFTCMPYACAVLSTAQEIVGLMIAVILRAAHGTQDILTSYNTFLCVHTDYRSQSFAMILIRAIMLYGHEHGVIHGYYLADNKHHTNNHALGSWYRVVNMAAAKSAGYTLLVNPQLSATAQRLTYHIPKPEILPRAATNFRAVNALLKRGKFHLRFTESEYRDVVRCFDVYCVSDRGLFMLFPITVTIRDSGKTVRNAHLALMIGDVFDQALWVCKEQNYCVLYGWYHGDITIQRVQERKGLTTVMSANFEVYNTCMTSSTIAEYMPII